MAAITDLDRAERTLERCHALGRISEEAGRLTRRFATPALTAAADLVLGWMRDAGLDARRDPIGNVVGRLPAERDDAPTLLLGSHIDTVPGAGRYDGPLGVAVALACAAGRKLPFALEVIAFADEEGVRYGTGYLGSSVVAGTFDTALLDRADDEGITMREAIRAAGGDPDALAAERRDPAALLGYVEVHIEQGPVLEQECLPVGVVAAIAGQSRAAVTFTGRAGHAGTVPMDRRRDALAGAAEWITAVEQRGRAAAAEGLVATVGTARIEPGAGNVIPGLAALSLDVRAPDDAARERARDDLRADAEGVAGRRGLHLAWETVQEEPAVACDPRLRERLADAVEATGTPVRALTSGAGHDAVAMSAIAPVAMLFVRCAGGVSHHPDESVERDDVAVAIAVLDGLIDGLVTPARARGPRAAAG